MFVQQKPKTVSSPHFRRLKNKFFSWQKDTAITNDDAKESEALSGQKSWKSSMSWRKGRSQKNKQPEMSGCFKVRFTDAEETGSEAIQILEESCIDIPIPNYNVSKGDNLQNSQPLNNISFATNTQQNENRDMDQKSNESTLSITGDAEAQDKCSNKSVFENNDQNENGLGREGEAVCVEWETKSTISNKPRIDNPMDTIPLKMEKNEDSATPTQTLLKAVLQHTNVIQQDLEGDYETIVDKPSDTKTVNDDIPPNTKTDIDNILRNTKNNIPPNTKTYMYNVQLDAKTAIDNISPPNRRTELGPPNTDAADDEIHSKDSSLSLYLSPLGERQWETLYGDVMSEGTPEFVIQTRIMNVCVSSDGSAS